MSSSVQIIFDANIPWYVRDKFDDDKLDLFGENIIYTAVQTISS